VGDVAPHPLTSRPIHGESRPPGQAATVLFTPAVTVAKIVVAWGGAPYRKYGATSAAHAAMTGRRPTIPTATVTATRATFTTLT
jgi:hypothetical protein